MWTYTCVPFSVIIVSVVLSVSTAWRTLIIRQLLDVSNHGIFSARSSFHEVGLWPYQFMPIGTGLAALVTQIYLGFRRAYDNINEIPN